ncbi:Helicase associated domain protein [Actinokineospora cianjurensis]|uniref:Helicase associated domain protein n=1 Tax=Actinokineospora cianjurensis TaxID=585224 RepID=UPI0014771E1F|nr:Helicase associated domain protein [Actinokineospora cianjurensis]
MSSRDDVGMVLELMERVGVSTQDLVDDDRSSRVIPTFAEVMPAVRQAASEAHLTAYRSYWNRVQAMWGELRLHEVSPNQVRELLAHTQTTAQVRRTSSDPGASAAINMFGALRFVFNYAVGATHLRGEQNPMNHVTKPRKPEPDRYAIRPELWERIQHVAGEMGYDPDLYQLILRLALESAARSGGMISIRLGDVDEKQAVVLLREKGGTQRWQPVTPTLARWMVRHARERGASDPDDFVLRRFTGLPVSYRDFASMWQGIGKQVPVVAKLGITNHWIRHTTLTWVERNFGLSVARAYAGHSTRALYREGITANYTKADIWEIAAALEALTGEDHPFVSGSAAAGGIVLTPMLPRRNGRSTLASTVTNGWPHAIAAARQYIAAHGDLRVPRTYASPGPEGFRLGEWVFNRRSDYRAGELLPDRIAELESIGMIWHPRKVAWAKRYEVAERYFRDRGTLKMSRSYVDPMTGIKLGLWVFHQRHRYRRHLRGEVSPSSGVITMEEIELLNQIGMVWR